MLGRRLLDSPPFLRPFVVNPPGVLDVGSHGFLLVFGLEWRAFVALALVRGESSSEAVLCEGCCIVKRVLLLLCLAVVNGILKFLQYAAPMYYYCIGYTPTVFMLSLDSNRGGLELVYWRRPRSSAAR